MATRDTTFQLDRSFRLIMQEFGLSEHAILRRAQLPADLLARDAPPLPCANFFALWRAMEAEAGIPDFAIKLVEGFRAEAFHPLLFASLSSSSFRVAARRISHYKRLIGPMALQLEERPGVMELEMRFQTPEVPPASLALFEMMFLLQLARMGTRSRIRAIDLEIPGEYEHIGIVEDFSGVRPRVGTRTAITLNATDVDLPFLTENSSMWEMFEPTLRKRLSDLETSASAAARVRAVLLEALPAGESSMEQVARKLATSKRTLQRRLRQEETTFQEILNETRESLARHYLRRTTLSGAEISYLLGFEDPNSFFRAFHHWTGLTTEQVRSATA